MQPDEHLLLAQYGDAAKLLYSPFSQFGVQDTVQFFEKRGLPIIVEDRNRAFPKSQNAQDVVDVLVAELKKQNVTVRTNCRVSKLIPADDGKTLAGVFCNAELLCARSIILATGGASHPETGSTGDGFLWLKDIGHTVAKPTPTIVPLAVAEDWIKQCSGTTFEHAHITFFAENKKFLKVDGNILATHFGVSGPTILNSAGKVGEWLEGGSAVTTHLDLFPQFNEGELDKHLIAVFEQQKNKEWKNVFKLLVPSQAVISLLDLLKENGVTATATTPIHSVSRDDRKKISKLLKALPLTITGLMGFEKAVVADGGIELSEVDLKTMRSQKYSNLYITGDLLHIKRPSGGFSLQLCWTTGAIAGRNA